MPLVNFSNIDFDQIKTSIKDYLRSNSNFTDYDFEGSNLSSIIDILAYNTYITSYNANMVSNEVFIDSATLRENVVSLARNIGYVPRSRKSAITNISFFVDTTNFSTNPVSLTLKAGNVITTSNVFSGESFSFSLLSDITVTVNSNGIAEFYNIDVYEGTYVTTNFTVNSFNLNQRFILENSGIDTSSISVIVKDSELSSVSRKYRKSDSLFDIDGNSAIYFVQEVEDERYELIFGDGIFGKKLQEPNYIEVSYLICNGKNANNLNSPFVFAGRLIDNDGRVITSGLSQISTNQVSYGGRDIEGIDSIRKYSTQVYASRNRAVTAQDYEAIIPTIYSETESVSVYGGEELTPPQYGKVFISVKPYNGVYLSNLIKENIKSSIKKYSVAGIVTEIVDLKYLYVEVDSNVYYNTNLAPSAAYVKSIVSSNILDYSDSAELNKFGARFKYSKFLKLIDDSHESITSNITRVTMRRDMRANLNSFTEYEICFGNRFHVDRTTGYNIKSSGFIVSGISGTVYFSDIPDANLETGQIFIFSLESPTQPKIIRRAVGTIDYLKGEIKLNPINIISTSVNRGESLIEFSISPYSNDVIGLQDLYLQLDNNRTTINMVSDQISSGGDISGTNYIVSSSYSNSNLVR
jgi:hypothetical protein